MAEKKKTKKPPCPVRIVVLQRGWVVVGRFSQDKEHCRLENAYVIRRWGTTKGLGELAICGPQSDTQLDATLPIQFHELTAVMHLECDEAKWEKHVCK